MEIHNKKNTSTVYNRIQLTWKFIGRTCVYYFGSSYISPSGEFQNFIENVSKRIFVVHKVKGSNPLQVIFLCFM